MTNALAPWFQRRGLGLLTDFYELTMMAGYWQDERSEQQVSFNYFFRSLPPHAGFAVAAGLGPFLDYVENLRFDEDDIAYLRGLDVFEEGFLDYLASFRPTIDIHAVPEGTLVYPFEPIVQVEGKLIEAQLIESALLNIMNYQTLIATKAARVCLAAEGDPVLEFGLRRAHGPDGGVSGARAAYIGGCSSTSNVMAGKVYDIPVAGTHAHSWVMSYPSEIEAFRTFARLFPKKCVLLVDTYDTVESGLPNAVRVFQEMRDQGLDFLPAVRLDSGDLAKLSKIAYRMLTEAGFENPTIVASNELTEDLIADLKRQGAKVNAWGVGTHLITARDNPSLNGVYKLVAVHNGAGWSPRIKISSNIEKATDPGRKALVRYYDANGLALGDVIYNPEETWPETGTIAGRDRTRPHRTARLPEAARAEPLLQPVLAQGRRVGAAPSVVETRGHVFEQISAMPEEFKRLRNPEYYQVLLSEQLGDLKDRLLADPDGHA
ncbi:MAG: nicotinate phosphoribosyltransferase [Candidatus Hydrogenedentota bacterium]